ncbi:unnamed protein product, partial [marine sediment metagenome]
MSLQPPKALQKKYRGCGLVEKILESEKASRLVDKELGKAIERFVIL